MAVVVALNRKRGNLKGQLTKLLSAITDEETMDIPQMEAQIEILMRVQEKFEVLKEDYYKSASDEEYLTIEASLSEIDQEIQHLEVRIKTSINKKKLSMFKVINTVQSSEKLNSFDSSRRINLQPIPYFGMRTLEFGRVVRSEVVKLRLLEHFGYSHFFK
ncbi:integrase catalytic domain-containing protein [Nephila pilipes]|uniref:Integrase catalytic domain-containing protein n=1 Tax=Nephila pilipes TaxID=299642 RepID=A0A8X6QKS1_NEPPI|nr:integrase catalytic domain-containing protein [Nephila pilipes]